VQTLQSLPKHKSLSIQTQLLICCTAGAKMKMKTKCFLKMDLAMGTKMAQKQAL